MKYFIRSVSSILDHQEKVRFGVNIIIDLLIGVLNVVFLGLLLVIINFYSTDHLPVIHFPDRSLFNKNSPTLNQIAKSQNSFFYDVAFRLSRQNMLGYLKGDYFKFVNIDSSVYTRKIRQQPIGFSNYTLTNIQQIISQTILIFFTTVGILFYHPSLFISLFILLMSPVILSGYYIKRRLSDVRANSKLTGQLTLQYLKESLGGYVESNVYDKNVFFTDRYYRYQKQLNGYIAVQQTLQGLPSRLIEVFSVLGFLILIATNKYFSGNHGIGLLDIGVFMAASYKIIPGVVKILNSAGQIKTYEFTLNDLQRDNEVKVDASPPATGICSIQFDKVAFSYRYNHVLNSFSFSLFPGDLVGITGPSGLGKTTIVNLLLGLLEQDSGTISINNTETGSADRRLFWNRISYCKQQSFFIPDSILKNITLTENAYDAAGLENVLSFCGIDHLLAPYPEGIDKPITENGKNISGGQKQRLMLARALYHDFDLLILDGPFSELDEISENGLLVKLKLLAQTGKMIIMITHNKSSLSFCNKIISLNES